MPADRLATFWEKIDAPRIAEAKAATGPHGPGSEGAVIYTPPKRQIVVSDLADMLSLEGIPTYHYQEKVFRDTLDCLFASRFDVIVKGPTDALNVDREAIEQAALSVVTDYVHLAKSRAPSCSVAKAREIRDINPHVPQLLILSTPSEGHSRGIGRDEFKREADSGCQAAKDILAALEEGTVNAAVSASSVGLGYYGIDNDPIDRLPGAIEAAISGQYFNLLQKGR